MKKFLFVIGFLLMVNGVRASDTYVAATAAGAGNGTSCANSYAYTDATHGTNGSQTADQGPDKIIHICGTITGSAGDQAVNINASGTSGHPFTIKFETGAILTSPVWGGNGGAVTNGGGWNYIVIDGGTNGIIRNTANGTGLANTANSHAVYMQSSSTLTNITIQNLTILNICQHTSPSDTTGCQTSGNTDAAIFINGASAAAVNNLLIQQNSISDTTTGIRYEAGSTSGSGNVIQWNTIRRMNWGINLGNGVDTGLNVYANDISCVPGALCNWDTGLANAFHHNGIMFDPQTGGSLWSGTIFNSNYIHDVNPSSAYIFIDPLTSGLITGTIEMNNIGFTTAGQLGSQNGMFSSSTAGFVFNNTMVGPDQLCIGGNTTPTAKNNICVNALFGELLAVGAGTTTRVSDYNDFFNNSDGFQDVSTNYANLAAWTPGTGLDAHSISTNPNLTAAFILNAGSPAIGTGTNLTSLGIAGLDVGAPQTFGVAGSCGTGCVSRSTILPWSMGAYEVSGNVTPTVPTGALPLTFNIVVPVVIPPIKITAPTLPATISQGTQYSFAIGATGCGTAGTSACACSMPAIKGWTVSFTKTATGCTMAVLIAPGTYTISQTVNVSVSVQ